MKNPNLIFPDKQIPDYYISSISYRMMRNTKNLNGELSNEISLFFYYPGDKAFRNLTTKKAEREGSSETSGLKSEVGNRNIECSLRNLF